MDKIPNDSQREGRANVNLRSGRPGVGETMLHLRISTAQREKFAQLGGAQWLYRMIDAAPHLPKIYTGEERIMAMLMRERP